MYSKPAKSSVTSLTPSTDAANSLSNSWDVIVSKRPLSVSMRDVPSTLLVISKDIKNAPYLEN
ncbi:MAG: hypothetical protein SPL10_06885 [Synergistales bacterium]|nr:hypothetical protein [Synergistales bacterium]MDY6404876.1 hypothetical protein [Synergistales bacterium]MDY6411109.1 hypothetical protein [Synergistales bacterium]MDY6414863.1 hypothetical protein [Synergistales bacterium]MDY6422627.1 hypothetical protein [Synergistales bacterium]